MPKPPRVELQCESALPLLHLGAVLYLHLDPSSVSWNAMWNCHPPPWCTDLLTPQNRRWSAVWQNIFAIQLTHCPLPPPAYLGKWKSPPLEMGLHNISLNSITNKFVDSLQKHLPWPCPSSRVRVEICPGIFSWHRNFFRHVFWSLINCQKATSRLSQGPWRQRFLHKN